MRHISTRLSVCLALTLIASGCDKPVEDKDAAPNSTVTSGSTEASGGNKGIAPNTIDASSAAETMANQYAASLPKSTTDKQRKAAHQLFQQSFFLGFLQPHSVVCTPSIHRKRGDQVGKLYRMVHPESVDSVMKGYGYSYVEVTGKYQVGFENSYFALATPLNDRPATEPKADTRPSPWWLSVFGSVDSNNSEIKSRFGPCDNLHVKGYLSPKGRYGHLGGAEREFLVREASCASSAQPTPPANPTLSNPGSPAAPDKPSTVPRNYRETQLLRLNGKTSQAIEMLAPMAQAGFRLATMDLLYVFVYGENDVKRNVNEALKYRDMAKAQDESNSTWDLACPDFHDPTKPPPDLARE